MEVYIELIYVINLVILIVSLEMMAILLNIEMGYKKTIGYSVLLNYSIMVLYVDNIYFLVILGGFITFLFLFKKQVFLYYPVFLCIYYSLLYFVNSFIPEAFIFQGTLVAPISYTNISIGIIAILFAIIQTMFIVYSKRKIRDNPYFFDVILTHKTQEIICQGFLDSGNEVYYLGFPLLLVNKNRIKEYQRIDTIWIDNIQEVQIDVVKMDSVIINKQVLKNVYVGMIENIKYDCLLNKQLMGGVI